MGYSHAFLTWELTGRSIARPAGGKAYCSAWEGILSPSGSYVSEQTGSEVAEQTSFHGGVHGRFHSFPGRFHSLGSYTKSM